MNPKIIENRPEGLIPFLVNSYRTTVGRENITLDFGKIEEDLKKVQEDRKQITVNVVTSVTFKPERLMDLVVKLFLAGIEYQEEYKKDIGFPSKKAFEDTKDDKEECK